MTALEEQKGGNNKRSTSTQLSKARGLALIVSAELHREDSRYAEAIVDAKQAIVFGDDLIATRAHRVMAESYEALGMLPEAIQQVQKWRAVELKVRPKLTKLFK